MNKKNDIDLYRMRNYLKSLILNCGSNNEIQFANKTEEIKFLQEYREFLTVKRQRLPNFIFDNFDAEKFKKCVEYKSTGHSLLETEDYYINNFKKQKKI